MVPRIAPWKEGTPDHELNLEGGRDHFEGRISFLVLLKGYAHILLAHQRKLKLTGQTV